MAKKLILTEQQHTVIINEILKETIAKIESNERLDEGFWDTIKYGLSKLGRYKADGKIFGKGKVDTQYAEKIKDILGKEVNEMIKKLDAEIQETNPEFPNNKDPQLFLQTVMKIAAVYDSIVVATKKQPEEAGYIPIDAANAIINDLREYTKKFLDVDLRAIYSAANEAKEITGENIMSEEYQLSEGQMCQLDEYFGLTKNEEIKVGDYVVYDEIQSRVSKVEGNWVEIEGPMGDKMMVSTSQVKKLETVDPREINEALPARTGGSQVYTSNQNPQVSGQASAGNYRKNNDIEDVDFEEIPNNPNNPNTGGNATQNPALDSGDVRSQLQAKKGDGEDFASTRMDTLKSNKLPMTLAGVGASLGAFSWLVNTEWFKSLFDVVTKNPSIEYIKQAVQEKTDIFASIKPNEGMTQIMNRMNGMNLNANSSPQDFINGVKQLGGGNVNDGIEALTQQGGIFADPEAAKKALTEIVTNPNAHGSNLGQVFQGQWAGTGESFGDSLVTQTGGSLKGMIVNTIIKAVPKLVIKTGVTTGAGYLAAKGLAGILGPIGIGLVTAGAVVKLLRMKGQKSSRAATLNALYQSMRGLDGGVGLIPAPTGDETGNDTGTDTGVDTGVDTGTGTDTGTDTGNGNGTGTDTGKQTTNNDTDGAMNDDLYNSLRNLFGFIVNSEKKFGKGPKNTLAEALLDEEMLDEAKYFRDKALVNFLNKNVSPTRVVEFENLLNRVEQLRNKIRNLKPTGDKVFDQFLERFRQNPIVKTDFNKMFNIVTVNQQAYQNMANFINDIFKTIYTGKYKQSGLIDKLGGIGKMNEADPNAARTQFEINAQDRKKFKKHLLQFLDDSIALFQYMVKLRKQAAASGKQTKTKQPKQNVSAAPRQQATEPVDTTPNATAKRFTDKKNNAVGTQTKMEFPEDPNLMEEIKRIKKIMLS